MDIVNVREVAWHHLAAVALRESLAAELLYSGRSDGLPGQAPARRGGVVAYTGVAFTPEGLPVGHAALRWSDDEVELQQVYVTPPYRRSGTAAALLAAAEDAARALHARRILLRPDDQQPEDDRFWEQAGYTRAGSIAPLASHCLEKVIMGVSREIHRERAAAGQAGR
jgi:GNAT superfamily N-acetyltransferase